MVRIDNFLVFKGFFETRTKSKQAIERGEIFVDGKQILRPAYQILDKNVNIEYKCQNQFVSLGGFKIEKALADFDFKIENLVVADIGASTGGFTDCLLQHGAKKVFAIDLNDTLLHEKLKNDKRVFLIVKNAKNLVKTDFSDELDLIVADLSFISITQIIPIFAQILQPNKKLLILIKPQFEVGEKKKFSNGIIKDENLHKKICDNVICCAKGYGFNMLNITTAPLNKNKNTEFLVLFEFQGKS